MKTGPPSPAVKLAARNLLVRSGGSERRLGYKDIPGPRSFPLIGNILGYRAPDVGRSVEKYHNKHHKLGRELTSVHLYIVFIMRWMLSV